MLLYSLLAALLVSLISFVGIFTLSMKKDLLDRLLVLMIGFAVGSLLGVAFFEMIPETIEKFGQESIFIYVMLGFVAFFFMERYFFWRHCHEGVCEVHAMSYLNILGDAIHNFTDGVVISVAFLADFNLGVATTVAIIFHEIPQEIGDFAIMVYGGFSRGKALWFNFLCGLTSVFGVLLGYFLAGAISNFSAFLIPFSAGGFIYIAASDLIPELHRQKNTKRANLSLVSFVVGLIFMWYISSGGGHAH